MEYELRVGKEKQFISEQEIRKAHTAILSGTIGERDRGIADAIFSHFILHKGAETFMR